MSAICVEEKDSILEISGKWPENEDELYDMKINAKAEHSQEVDEDEL